LVCDQASTNVAAINKLRAETNAKYLHLGQENRLFGFEINNQEIIPLFDPPHLLKCLRNNLLTKNLMFTCKDKIQPNLSKMVTHNSVL